MIIKVYQISPILIDYNRLMQGEEGIIVYFDIEPKADLKGKNSSKVVNLARIKAPSKKEISDLLKEISSSLSKKRL